MSPYDAEEIAELSLERDHTDDVMTYVCARCGAPLDTNEKHPVVARSNGDPTVLLFCGDACRTDWLDEEAEGR